MEQPELVGRTRFTGGAEAPGQEQADLFAQPVDLGLILGLLFLQRQRLLRQRLLLTLLFLQRLLRQRLLLTPLFLQHPLPNAVVVPVRAGKSLLPGARPELSGQSHPRGFWRRFACGEVYTKAP